MKLITISEKREHFTFFRGVPNLTSLINILNRNLDNESWAKYWTRDIEIAMIYSLYGPYGTKTDKKAYIAEALLNINDKNSTGDEDAIAIGEAPFRNDYNKEWDKWFDKYFPELPSKLRPQFVDEYNTNGGITRKWAKWVRIEKNKIRRGNIKGTHLNVVTNKPIGYRGSNKIIGAYIMAPIPSTRNFSIIKKIGNGSLDPSQEFKAAREFNN